MKIKVCGMRGADNIASVAKLNIDLMGFIFFEKSSRYVGHTLASTPKGLGRVGVFVDESPKVIIKMAETHHLTHLQLHGEESPQLCSKLKERGYTIIKAFQISSRESFAQCAEYRNVVDMLLFDTASAGYGGSGESFDWSWLEAYDGDLPYILSGGISIDEIDNILKIKDNRLWGVDINSRFEIAPAVKDVWLLKNFIDKLRSCLNLSTSFFYALSLLFFVAKFVK